MISAMTSSAMTSSAIMSSAKVNTSADFHCWLDHTEYKFVLSASDAPRPVRETTTTGDPGSGPTAISRSRSPSGSTSATTGTWVRWSTRPRSSRVVKRSGLSWKRRRSCSSKNIPAKIPAEHILEKLRVPRKKSERQTS